MAKTQDLLLLTGASGFIGVNILQHFLASTQHRVRIALRPTAGLAAILALPSVAPFAHRVESVIVPKIDAPGAYDEAVRGARWVIHCASPLPGRDPGDYETLVEPVVRAKMNMLEAAEKEPGIEKVVLTASLASIASPFQYPGPPVLVDEETRLVKITGGPYANPAVDAYLEGMAAAFAATEEFIAKNKPRFSVINIMPSIVLGPNPHKTKRSNYNGTPGYLLKPFRGYAFDFPLHGITVHVDDVARMHVEALLQVSGHELFIANSNHRGITWADAADIVRRRFPKEVEDGVLDVKNFEERAPTTVMLVDGRKAQRAMGIEYQTFEEQVVDTIGHYVSLEA